MDIVITLSSDPKVYHLRDRLGRTAGEIQRFTHLGYYIMPEVGGALDGLPRGMFRTLEDAIAAIARHTKGACQLTGGEQEPRPASERF